MIHWGKLRYRQAPNQQSTAKAETLSVLAAALLRHKRISILNRRPFSSVLNLPAAWN